MWSSSELFQSCITQILIGSHVGGCWAVSLLFGNYIKYCSVFTYPVIRLQKLLLHNKFIYFNCVSWTLWSHINTSIGTRVQPLGGLLAGGGGGGPYSLIGKGHRAGASVYFGHMSSFLCVCEMKRSNS